MTTTLDPHLPSSKKQVVCDLSYPHLGAAQHLCVIRTPQSESRSRRSMLESTDVARTVLGPLYYPDADFYLPTPLPAPHDLVRLPSLALGPNERARLLREQPAYDDQGRCLGRIIEVPGLFVKANRMLEMHRAGRRYNHARSLAQMAVDAARLMATVLRRGVLKVRHKPAFFGHAIARAHLGLDRVGISEAFADEIYDSLQLQGRAVPLRDDLNGYPVWAARFPIANRWGMQQLYLQILEGRGRYVAANPWNLGPRWLADCDGDCLYVLLRQAELLAGTVRRDPLPLLPYNSRFDAVRPPRLTLASLRDASLARLPPTLAGKAVDPELATLQDRLTQIQRCDARTWVATFTMVFGWWVPRILASYGQMSTQAAYEAGYDALEWWMEASMDARKGKSQFEGFPIYQFMETLTNGSEDGLPYSELQRLKERAAMPDRAVAPLYIAWELAGGHLKAACQESPAYDTLILQRSRMERSVTALLTALQHLNVKPEHVYQAIVNDLSGLKLLQTPLNAANRV